MGPHLRVGVFFLGLALSGCASIFPQTNALNMGHQSNFPVQAELDNVPFFAQTKYQCGPASLAMVLNAAGVGVAPGSLVTQVYIPERKGSLQVEMLAATRRHGLIAYELAQRLTDVIHEIAAGTPVVVLENYGNFLYPVWHYAVAVGYDLGEGRIMRRSGAHARQSMPFEVFEYLWEAEGHWAMVALPPDRLPATATEARYANAVSDLEKSGQVQNARIAYSTLLRRWPNSLAGQMGLGNTAYAMKDLESARSAFTKATQDHPDAVAALNNLAQVLAELGEIDAALTAAGRAVSLGGPLLETTRTTLQEIRKEARVPPGQ